jgi:hypothetical protein
MAEVKAGMALERRACSLHVEAPRSLSELRAANNHLQQIVIN